MTRIDCGSCYLLLRYRSADGQVGVRGTVLISYIGEA
jgi:hypothetical protein